MRLGMAVIFQNPANRITDDELYRSELTLADRAEDLGFESLWAVEHHFTDYTICPDPLQFLTYMAGRTESLKLGSMVVVLPWHNPVRVAEQIAVLEAVSGGRFIFGMGRGIGKIEFEGLGVPMEESRERFCESAEIVLGALEKGVIEYSGTHYQIPRRDLRPAASRSFQGRTYAAAVSPESVDIMAKLGVGLLFIPQKPWAEVKSDLDRYTEAYKQLNRADPPKSTLAGWVFCDEDESRAEGLAQQYISEYYRSTMAHYELAGAHFEGKAGYEHYRKTSRSINAIGEDSAAKNFMDLQFWGTPDQVTEKIRSVVDLVNADRFIGAFGYAGMPYAEAHRNLDLFVSKVAPNIS